MPGSLVDRRVERRAPHLLLPPRHHAGYTRHCSFKTCVYAYIRLNTTYTLEAFTRALNCLLKYSEELTINATPQTLTLSAVNSSKSAYCRFNYDASFFSRYNVGSSVARPSSQVEETLPVKGQLLTKVAEIHSLGTPGNITLTTDAVPPINSEA